VLDEGEWYRRGPVRLNQGKNAGTDRMGGWVGPRAGLDVLEKGYMCSNCLVSKSGPTIYLLDGLSCYTDFGILTPLNSLVDLHTD